LDGHDLDAIGGVVNFTEDVSNDRLGVLVEDNVDSAKSPGNSAI
jgi:hypothetical protein